MTTLNLEELKQIIKEQEDTNEAAAEAEAKERIRQYELQIKLDTERANAQLAKHNAETLKLQKQAELAEQRKQLELEELRARAEERKAQRRLDSITLIATIFTTALTILLSFVFMLII